MIVADAFTQAEKSLGTAEYLLFQTFQGLKDTKLLLAILEHLVTAADYAVSGYLEYLRSKKEIPPYNKTNFELKISLIQKRGVEELGIDKKLPSTLLEMHHLTKLHKKSPVEFAAKAKYVMADDGFNRVEVLTEQKIKAYYQQTQQFVAACKAQYMGATAQKQPKA
ncbi:MAG: hypothetical protein QW594_00100 [Candidatus Woesearchaeota archaeon]